MNLTIFSRISVLEYLKLNFRAFQRYLSFCMDHAFKHVKSQCGRASTCLLLRVFTESIEMSFEFDPNIH